MIGSSREKLLLAILGVFFVGVLISSGCTQNSGSETPGIQGQEIKTISTEEGHALIQEFKGDPNFVIIDIRTPGEYAQEHIDGAINIDFYSPTFKDDLNKLDKEKQYVIYCRSGSRTGQSVSIFKELNFMKVLNLGGINNWKAKGYPIVK